MDNRFSTIGIALALTSLLGSAAYAADFFPLKVGKKSNDSWVYQFTGPDGKSMPMMINVVGTEKAGKGEYLLVDIVTKDQTVHGWYTKSAGMLLKHKERIGTNTAQDVNYTPPYFFKNPLVKGDTWKWAGKNLHGQSVKETFQVVGTEAVSVPAGKYTATKVINKVAIDGSPTPMVTTMWFADQVGLVKSTTEMGKVKFGSDLSLFTNAN